MEYSNTAELVNKDTLLSYVRRRSTQIQYEGNPNHYNITLAADFETHSQLDTTRCKETEAQITLKTEDEPRSLIAHLRSHSRGKLPVQTLFDVSTYKSSSILI